MSYFRTGLDLITRIFTTRINVDRARGYDDVANSARISPLAVISEDLKHDENTAIIAEAALNLVTSYYLKALPMSQEIGGAEVIKTLRRLSPDPKGKIDYNKMGGSRRAGLVSSAGKFLPSMLSDDEYETIEVSNEDFLGFIPNEYSLEASNNRRSSPRKTSNPTVSSSSGPRRSSLGVKVNPSKRSRTASAGYPKSKPSGPYKPPKRPTSVATPEPVEVEEEEAPTSTFGDRGVSSKILEDTSPIEKHTDITINTEHGKVTVPITLALQTHFVTNGIMNKLLSGETVEDSFIERYYAMRAGVIGVTDFIFALDMIKKKKKLLIEDKSNVMKEIIERREAGWTVTAVEGFHLGEATNVAIVSREVANQVANIHRGKISSNTVRSKIFADLSLMVLAVVDREDEFVTFYYRNVKLGSSKKISSLKKVNKNGGPDIVETLRALNAGNKPIF